MAEKQQNFTKEFAANYFQDYNDQPVLVLDHTFPDTVIRVLLKKESDEDFKKVYNFYIFVNWQCVYENRKKKSKWDSFDEVFSTLYKLPEYKLYKKQNSVEVLSFDTEGFMNDFWYLVEEGAQNLFEDKEDLTKDELNNYLMKAFEDPKVQEKILELKEMNTYILGIEANSANIKEIPEELFEIALRWRGTVSKLEKVLINKAKKVIVKCYLENISLSNDYIKEFDIRFFDYNIHGENSPSRFANWTKVPKDKNLYRLAELESKNSRNQFSNVGHSWKWVYQEELSGIKTMREESLVEEQNKLKIKLINNEKNQKKLSELEISQINLRLGKIKDLIKGEEQNRQNVYTYVTSQRGKLEIDLGWDYLDIVNYLALKMKESIYFFRPSQQEKEISLDTYLTSVIKNSLNTLRNYTCKVDSSGNTRRWKDDLIIRKLKEVKYILDEARYSSSSAEEGRQYEFNVENVVRELTEYNDTVKDQGARILEKDVREFINSLATEKLDMDSFVEWEDGQTENGGVLSEIWGTDWVGSNYDTHSVGEERFKQEKVTDTFKQIFPSNEEQVSLEFILDNFSNLKTNSAWASKKAMKVDSVEFNKIYVTLWEPELTQTEVDSIVEWMVTKILLNRDLFKKILFRGEDDVESIPSVKKANLSDQFIWV